MQAQKYLKEGNYLEPESISRADKKLLQIAVRSGQDKRLSIRDIAEEAGRTDSFVYSRLQDEQFRAMWMEALKTSLVAETPAILQKFTEMAKNGSFQHGKLILEIAGVADNEKRVTMNANIRVTEQPFKDDEQKESFIKATLHKYLETDDNGIYRDEDNDIIITDNDINEYEGSENDANE